MQLVPEDAGAVDLICLPYTIVIFNATRHVPVFIEWHTPVIYFSKDIANQYIATRMLGIGTFILYVHLVVLFCCTTVLPLILLRDWLTAIVGGNPNRIETPKAFYCCAARIWDVLWIWFGDFLFAKVLPLVLDFWNVCVLCMYICKYICVTSLLMIYKYKIATRSATNRLLRYRRIWKMTWYFKYNFLSVGFCYADYFCDHCCWLYNTGRINFSVH